MIKPGWYSVYTLMLGLWVGGMAIFTFIVTPAIFRSFDRDAAGGIVGKLFPGYFLYTLALTIAACILFFLVADLSRMPARISIALIAAAICISLFVNFKLQPAAVSVKQQISSFVTESPDSPTRREFRRLHAISALLNLLLLADGTALLLIAPLIR